MMFTDREIQAYRSIKMPENWVQNIEVKPKKTKWVWYSVAAMAACVMLFVSGVWMSGQSNITVYGQKLRNSAEFYLASSAMERSVSSVISVPLEITVSDRTTVSVDDGFVYTEAGEPAKEIEIHQATVLWWEIEPQTQTMEFEMHISDQKSVQKILLTYENTKITVTKE